MRIYAQLTRSKMNQIETIILEFFENYPEAKIADIIEKTGIARRTLQKYLKLLVEQENLEVHGKGRGRYYRRVYQNKEELSHLAVLKNEVLIGKLSYGNGSYQFHYDKNYQGADLLELSRPSNNLSATLYPIFENLLPEYERRRKLLNNFSDPASILPTLDNVQGDFKFIPYYELFKYKSTQETRPVWHTVKHHILSENSYPNLWQYNIDISDEILEEQSQEEHSSLSGYQHKIDIHVDFEKGVITEAKESADYLLKPLNRTMTNYFSKDKNHQKHYYPLLALNEHLFMSFAKNKLHLNTPQTAIIQTKEKEFHYIVKRYDRHQAFSYGQYDMAQLLTIPSDKKYHTDTLTLMNTFAKYVKDETARLDMLKFQVYASLIHHSDFHAKNMGILDIGKSNYILTPLYDVISVGAYNGESHDLGLPLSQEIRKFSHYTLDDYLMISRALNIGNLKAKQTIKNTIEIFLDRFPDYIEKTLAFEKEHNSKIQKSRTGKKSFSNSLRSMYDRKLIQLKKQGVLQELKLINKYGGPLNAERKLEL